MIWRSPHFLGPADLRSAVLLPLQCGAARRANRRRAARLGRLGDVEYGHRGHLNRRQRSQWRWLAAKRVQVWRKGAHQLDMGRRRTHGDYLLRAGGHQVDARWHGADDLNRRQWFAFNASRAANLGME